MGRDSGAGRVPDGQLRGRIEAATGTARLAPQERATALRAAWLMPAESVSEEVRCESTVPYRAEFVL